MSGHLGDETFERWFREYHARLLAQCRRIVGDAATAEDIAQETLLRAWLGRDRMREEDLGAWLSVVARNLCISHLRRQKKQIPTEVLPETPDESIDPARVVERLESRRAVRRAMRQIGERHGRVIQLRDMEGMGYEELGARLGLSKEGTRTVLFRARRVLRERLAAVGEGMAAFVGGVKAGVRSVILRGRSTAENASNIATPIGPSALNAVVAFTITIAVFSGGGTFVAGAAGSAPRSQALAAPTAGSYATRSTTRVGATRYERAADRFPTALLNRPSLDDPPDVTGRPYRCGEGDTLVEGNVAGQYFDVYNFREEGELAQPAYEMEDVAFDAASNNAPSLCRRLGQPIEVAPGTATKPTR